MAGPHNIMQAAADRQRVVPVVLGSPVVVMADERGAVAEVVHNVHPDEVVVEVEVGMPLLYNAAHLLQVALAHRFRAHRARYDADDGVKEYAQFQVGIVVVLFECM